MRALRSCLLTAAATAAAVAAAPAAEAKVVISVIGWSTSPTGNAVEAKNGRTLTRCNDTGNGQRNLRVIVRGKGITKNTKVGIGVWGGSSRAGAMPEPTTADVMKAAFRWPVPPSKAYTQPFGFSYAPGPFGPIDTNGVWYAKVVMKGKVVARGTVTVACR